MRKVIDMGGFWISKRQKELVNEVLKTTRLSYGPMTQKFEKMWSQLHKVKYSMFCNSGTSALQVALHALKEKYDWKEHHEVIIPSVTFVATMNIVLHNNMRVQFVDVDPYTFNIDPKEIEKKINPNTKAIIVVHLLGQPAEMDKIMKIARKYKLKVIEDSCETVGASYNGIPVGTWGDVSCFSTYASHLVVTGVGGFACTNNSDLALRIRGLYNHGRDGIYNSIDDNKKGTQIMKSRFHFTHSGYSYRGTEMEAALGIGHMERFSIELKARQALAKTLIDLLSDLEEKGWIILPKTHPNATHSYMLFSVVLNPKVDREKFLKYLEKNGVMTRYLMPLLNQPITKKLFSNLLPSFPVAAHVDKHAFLLGMHPELTKGDLRWVSVLFHKYFHGKKL